MQTFFVVKDQQVNTLGFVGLTLLQLFKSGVLVQQQPQITQSKWVWLCVNKIYLQKQDLASGLPSVDLCSSLLGPGPSFHLTVNFFS